MKTLTKLAAIYMLIGTALFGFTGAILLALRAREYREPSVVSLGHNITSPESAPSDNTSSISAGTDENTVKNLGLGEGTGLSKESSPTENACGFVPKAFWKQTVLISQDGTQINVRIRPDINSTAMNAGNPNDLVDVLGEALDDEGCQWVRVRFGSGEEGWIRADFLNADYRG